MKYDVLDHHLTFLISSNSASWRCGFFIVSASDGLPRATYFVVQQHFPAQCPAKIFRTRNMGKDCKIQVGGVKIENDHIFKQFRDKIGARNGFLSREEQREEMETGSARLHPRN